jgi:hypothetical protein
MKDSMQTTSIVISSAANCRECNTSTTRVDLRWFFFELLFSDKKSMKEKNKHLILEFQDYISRDCINLVNDILADHALEDLHPSLIKSALIMTSSIAEKLPARQKATEILAMKMSV